MPYHGKGHFTLNILSNKVRIYIALAWSAAQSVLHIIFVSPENHSSFFNGRIQHYVLFQKVYFYSQYVLPTSEGWILVWPTTICFVHDMLCHQNPQFLSIEYFCTLAVAPSASEAIRLWNYLWGTEVFAISIRYRFISYIDLNFYLQNYFAISIMKSARQYTIIIAYIARKKKHVKIDFSKILSKTKC